MAAICHSPDLICGGAVVILWRDLLVGRGQVKKPSVKKRLTDAALWQIKRRVLAFRHCIPSRLSANGAIAQLGERLLCKQEVVGSIPSGSTTFNCIN